MFKASNYCIRDWPEGITIEKGTRSDAFDLTVQFYNFSRGPIAITRVFPLHENTSGLICRVAKFGYLLRLNTQSVLVI